MLITAFLAAAVALVYLCKRLRLAAPPIAGKPVDSAAVFKAGPFAGLWAELFGLFVDDGWLAAGVVTWLLIAWKLPALHLLPAQLSVAFATGLLVVLALSVTRRARRL